ncbi:MAG: hypothetical protein ABIR18_06200 [Chitinophagaceae bacterium]
MPLLTRKDLCPKQKGMYLFGPTSWSHDESRLTNGQLRENERHNS